MKTLICSEMLLSLITIAMALASSSPRSNFSSSLYHLVMLSLLSRAALNPSLDDVHVLIVLLSHSCEVLALKIWMKS